MKVVIMIAASMAWVLTASLAVDVIVDGAVTHQTMDGFGVNVNSLSWDDGELQPALDMLVDQLGATIYRVILDEMDWEAVNDDGDPNHFNWTYYNAVYGGPKFQELWRTLRYLNGKGIESGLMVNFMGKGPDWMGPGSTILETMEDEFVETIASAIYYGRVTEGVRFTLLAPMNEPDLDGIEGPFVGPAQYTRILAKLAARLDAIGLGDIRFVGPDGARTITDLQNFGSAMLTNAAVMAKMTRWAIHSYGPSVDGASAFIAASAYPGLRFWVTETARIEHALEQLSHGPSATLVWDGFDAVYNHAIRAGRGTVPHNDLGNGPALIRYDTTTRLYTPRREFYEYAQLFRFVAPGSMRIGASDNDSNVLFFAFRHPTTGRLTLVGRNANSGAATLNGTLLNLATPPQSFATYLTNTSQSLARVADVPVTGSSFSVSIPGNTVFTLFGSSGLSVALTQPSVPARFNAPANITLEAAASPGSTGTISKVEFFHGTTLLGEDASAPFSWTWNAVSAGTYQVTARVTDSGNQTATSEPISVSVAGPVAAISVIPGSTTLGTGGTVQFSAVASDADGRVRNPQPAFTWNANGAGAISSSGHFTATALPSGPHLVTASDGAALGSAVVNVGVATGGSIGSTGEGTFADNIWSDGAYINACRFQAAGAMSVNVVRAKVAAATGRFRCALYSDDNGVAKSLLRASAEVVNPASGWNEFALGSPMELAAGDHYWIAIWSDSPDARVYATHGGTLRWGAYPYGAWPDPISLPTGSSVTYSIYATGSASSAFTQWKLARGLSADAPDDSDDDRDGLPLLAEYAFGSDPGTSDAATLTNAELDGGHLTLTYPRNKSTTDILVTAEVSSDLVVWSSATDDVQQIWRLVDGPTEQTITARDLTASSPGTRRFLRLRITQP